MGWAAVVVSREEIGGFREYKASAEVKGPASRETVRDRSGGLSVSFVSPVRGFGLFRDASQGFPAIRIGGQAPWARFVPSRQGRDARDARPYRTDSITTSEKADPATAGRPSPPLPALF